MTQATDKEMQSAQERLAHLAEEQGVRPVDFKALLSKAPGGPGDETADEMIAGIYQWRRRIMKPSKREQAE